MKFYKAYYDSRSFSFETYAKTEDAAKSQMVHALQTHTRQYNLLDNDWWNEDDIGITEHEFGKYYRDQSLFGGENK